ncbi:MAG: Nif3-like dinuclear metal center hexameric protein [Caldilineaceae bacterium]|nr:Nif3-like dinuclear metal center hexameric protein [Caldilineaceae bacterium]
MVTIQEITHFVEEQSGHPLNRDEGVHHGSAERSVQRATVCWMATPDAIRAAGARGDDLLIGHESLYYPYDVVNLEKQPPGWEEWPTNQQRRTLLEQYNLTFLRLHGSVDDICILSDFAEQLGLGAPVHEDGLVHIYEIEPCSFAELVARVKAGTGMAGLRVAPAEPMPQEIRRIGLPWGGMALFVNVGYMQKLIALGCEALIAGETDNYGFRFPQELGIPMIETSHEISENRGLRHFTAMLAEAFPTVDFHFFENGCVWEMW